MGLLIYAKLMAAAKKHQATIVNQSAKFLLLCVHVENCKSIHMTTLLSEILSVAQLDQDAKFMLRV